jgi:RNA polymerase subunit RPABC4/transcription elongation factor Spt4
MNWNNVSLVVLGLSAFLGAFVVALWISLVIWAFRDMRARSRDAFAQLLAAVMIFVLGPVGAILYLLLRPRETLAEKYERSLEEEALLQDIEGRQVCPGCKQPIESDYVLCPICHTRLRQPCVHCERLIHTRWSLCPYCASSQKPIPGVDKAGRVTLLDLEQELPEVEVEEMEVEPEISLEPVAEPVRQVYGASTEARWERQVAEAENRGELSSLFSGPDEISSDASPARQTDPLSETDAAADEKPRRPLSLFKRP